MICLKNLFRALNLKVSLLFKSAGRISYQPISLIVYVLSYSQIKGVCVRCVLTQTLKWVIEDSTGFAEKCTKLFCCGWNYSCWKSLIFVLHAEYWIHSVQNRWSYALLITILYPCNEFLLPFHEVKLWSFLLNQGEQFQIGKIQFGS